jgi:hypothetical protein
VYFGNKFIFISKRKSRNVNQLFKAIGNHQKNEAVATSNLFLPIAPQKWRVIYLRISQYLLNIAYDFKDFS